MARVLDKAAAPPPLDLDDAGLEWHRDGAALVVERRPSVRSAMLPAMFALGFGVVALTLVRTGQPALGALLAAIAALGLGGVLVALAQHTALHVGRGGMQWETNLPRRRAGAWAREAITAVRVRGEGKGPWAVGKQVFAEVLVAGEWVVVGLGHSPARANDFVSGLCAALGVRREESVPLAQVV